MTLKDDRPGPGARPVHSLTSDVLSAVRAAGLATASDAKREFEFTAADFDRIKRLIHEHAGIVLSPTKQDMVYGRLARRLRDRRLRNFAEYLDRLSGDRMEWEAFVNALTTNLTSFFREAHHFDILTERLKKPGIDRPYQDLVLRCFHRGRGVLAGHDRVRGLCHAVAAGAHRRHRHQHHGAGRCPPGCVR